MTPPDLALTLDSDRNARAGVRSGTASVSSAPGAPSSASASKWAVMDLAYTEFLQHQERGEAFDLEAFCARFPGCRSSLLRLLKCHQFIDDNPAYLGIPWPKVGEKHGDLTLLRELGRGTFSRVFLATEASTGDRLVVVKFSQGGDAEARTQGPLAHPHIVPVLSASRDETTELTAVRMPYLGSATLEDVLDRAWPAPTFVPGGPGKIEAGPARKADVIPGALRACAQPEDPPAGAVHPRLRTGHYADGVIHLAGQIAEALAFLHARGVCHRDLKPSNVLLDPSGKPLLLDFNLSTRAREAAQPTGGTLRYMAPEQLHAYLSKNWEGLDERADLFALAVMIYELLSGDHPHGPIPPDLKDQPLAVFLLGRMQDRFRPLREVCPDVAAPVARALERCLAVNPANRPQSAAELAVALKRQFAPARRIRRWMADRRLAILTALCLLLGGSVATGVAWGVRPPYSEREYQRGVDAYRAGRFDEAEQCFDRAFRADPKNSRCRAARGAARFQQSKYLEDGSEKLDQAWNDLKGIEGGEPDAPTIALRAYLLNREQKPEEAIRLYGQLLQGSYRRAMVLNNRAYSYRLRNRRDGFLSALRDLDEAVRLDPNAPAIRYNRATCVRLLWSDQIASPRHRHALDDIDRAIELGPPTWELYSGAARLYALAAYEDLCRGAAAQTVNPSLLGVPLAAALHRRGQDRIERCLSHVSEALVRGDRTISSRDLEFRFLNSSFPLPAQPQGQPQAIVPAIDLCLIDPVELPD